MDPYDQELRRLYRDNRARVDLRTFKTELVGRLPTGRQDERRKSVKYVLIAASAVILLVGLGFGVSELALRLSKEGRVLVITDAPAPSQPSTTGTVATSSTIGGVDNRGLWAGNVNTIPAKPASLPAQFYREPSDSTQLERGNPQWVFANELTTAAAATAIGSAPKEQTILVFYPTEQLCQLLDIPRPMRPSSLGELPTMFTQSPVLCREEVYPEVGPHWSLLWAQLNEVGAQTLQKPDPQAVYATAAKWTMQLEENRKALEANQQAQSDETTPTTDPYPIQQTIESKEAQALAHEAAQYLATLAGHTFSVQKAAEEQMIGPGAVIEFREQVATLVEPGTGRLLTYGLFWSNEDQIGGSDHSGLSGVPTATFDAADGSTGYIQARSGYYGRLQLRSGWTAFVQTTGGSPLQPVAEQSILTPQQLIVFTEWLAEHGIGLQP